MLVCPTSKPLGNSSTKRASAIPYHPSRRPSSGISPQNTRLIQLTSVRYESLSDYPVDWKLHVFLSVLICLHASKLSQRKKEETRATTTTAATHTLLASCNGIHECETRARASALLWPAAGSARTSKLTHTWLRDGWNAMTGEPLSMFRTTELGPITPNRCNQYEERLSTQYTSLFTWLHQ